MPTDPEDMPEKVKVFATKSKLAESDTAEWLIFHSYLTDEHSGKCAISPPMLALTWDMAQIVFNSLLEAALSHMSEKYSQAFFACMEDCPTELRVGVFPELTDETYPDEVIIMMDRRALTMEVYNDFYIRSSTGRTTVKEMPKLQAVEKPVMH